MDSHHVQFHNLHRQDTSIHASLLLSLTGCQNMDSSLQSFNQSICCSGIFGFIRMTKKKKMLNAKQDCRVIVFTMFSCFLSLVTLHMGVGQKRKQKVGPPYTKHNSNIKHNSHINSTYQNFLQFATSCHTHNLVSYAS